MLYLYTSNPKQFEMWEAKESALNETEGLFNIVSSVTDKNKDVSTMLLSTECNFAFEML